MSSQIIINSNDVLRHIIHYLTKYPSVGKLRLTIDICSIVLEKHGVKLEYSEQNPIIENEYFLRCKRCVDEWIRILRDKDLLEVDDFVVNVKNINELKKYDQEIMKIQDLEKVDDIVLNIEQTGKIEKEVKQTRQVSISKQGVEGLKKKVIIKKGDTKKEIRKGGKGSIIEFL